MLLYRITKVLFLCIIKLQNSCIFNRCLVCYITWVEEIWGLPSTKHLLQLPRFITLLHSLEKCTHFRFYFVISQSKLIQNIFISKHFSVGCCRICYCDLATVVLMDQVSLHCIPGNYLVQFLQGSMKLSAGHYSGDLNVY
jgi:hypothetical protein